MARKDLGEHQQIVVERDGEEPLRGMMWFKDGVVNVMTLDGRLKTTLTRGYPPEVSARMLLLEMENERVKAEDEHK